MIETNIRIFPQRDQLYLWVRKANISGSHISDEIAEKACVKLIFDKRLPAIVAPGDCTTLLIATKNPIQAIPLKGQDWTVTITDCGEPACQIFMRDLTGSKIIPPLLERALICRLADTDYWTEDSSKIWYEPYPFATMDDIDAYRRYRVGAAYLDEEGAGIAVKAETAFFTANNLAHYLDKSVGVEERTLRMETMNRLMNRQEGQKGTLLYNNGRHIMKCYFVDAPGFRCNETPKIRVDNKDYANLAEYYREVMSELDFDPAGEAVRVSFKKGGTPVYVAAELLRIRVMNDSLPRRLSSADKITPEDHRLMIINFWESLGESPFGHYRPKLVAGFWQPDPSRLHQFTLPDLVFGKNAILSAPQEMTVETYKNHFRQRLKYLDTYGCWRVPPTLSRTLYFAYPQEFDKEIVIRLGKRMAQRITQWTGINVKFADPIPYSSVLDATTELAQKSRYGVAVFILDREPGTYYEAAFQLDHWRIKRITQETLIMHNDYLLRGKWNRHKSKLDIQMGQRRWFEYIDFNAYAILQLLGVIPFVPINMGDYEAQLFIDVGHERKEFVLSLLVARNSGKKPDFVIQSQPIKKIDTQRDSINPHILATEMSKLLLRTIKHRHDPLTSILIERDGRLIGKEGIGIESGVEKSTQNNCLVDNAQVDWIDLRKSSGLPIRFWDVSDDGVVNPLEGYALKLNTKTVAVVTTGAATLTQGTASPYIIVANEHCPDILKAAKATFLAAQMNWSSPRVAQRLPLHVKAADEDLQTQAAQRIRRVK